MHQKSLKIITLVSIVFVIFLLLNYKSDHLPTEPTTAAKLISQGAYQDAFSFLTTSNTFADTLSVKSSTIRSIQLALCEYHLGRPDNAIMRLQKISQQAIPSLLEYRQLWIAKALHAMDQHDDAARICLYLLDSISNSVIRRQALKLLAETYFSQKAFSKALAIYQLQMDEFHNTISTVLWTMANTYTHARKPDRAHECYLKLLHEYRSTPEGLSAAIKISGPLSPDDAFIVAQTYLDHERYKDAIHRFKRFIDHYPRHIRASSAQYLLGRALSGNGQFDLAISAFNKAHKLGVEKALYRIGDTQIKQNNELIAIKNFEKFAEQYPNHDLADDALWQAAKAAERNSQFTDSKRLYTRIVDDYPQSNHREDAEWGLGFSYFCLDSLSQALATFDHLSLTANEAHMVDQSLYWAGKTSEKQNRLKQARNYYKKAAVGFPRSYYSTRAVHIGYEPIVELSKPKNEKNYSHRTINFERSEMLNLIGLRSEARAEIIQIRQQNKHDLDKIRALRDHCELLGFMDMAVNLSLKLVNDNHQSVEWARIYPDYYWEEIDHSAKKADIDPYLIQSVIRQESRFNTKAVSRVGARGLMQIMPETGKKLARNLGITDYENIKLYDPNLSIRLGSQFLGNQVRQFKRGNTPHLVLELGLAAYNAGPHNARKWLERFPYADADIFIERIPFKETRLYVKLVLKNYQIYKALANV